MTKKEGEKILKHKVLPTELQRMWNIKTEVIPVIVGAIGTISETLRHDFNNIPGKQEITELQKKQPYLALHTYSDKC